MKPLSFLVVASLAISGCASMEQKDREWAGTASPAVAMFAAQSEIAPELCPAAPDSLKRRENLIAKVRHAGLMVDTYRNQPSFAQALSESQAKYRMAWSSMSANERNAFCNEYYQDLSSVTSSGAHIAADKIRMHFSPPTKAARDRQARGAMVLGAASIAATAGGVAQADNANFDGATRLNDAGQIIASAIPSNSASPGSCPAYGHFTQQTAPASHEAWKRYVSLRSCQ